MAEGGGGGGGGVGGVGGLSSTASSLSSSGSSDVSAFDQAILDAMQLSFSTAKKADGAASAAPETMNININVRMS